MENLELMNDAIELVGETVDTGEVIEAVTDNVGIVGKVLKYGGPVVLVVGTGALIYLGVKKFKKALAIWSTDAVNHKLTSTLGYTVLAEEGKYYKKLDDL